jgi:hypothetical protein
MGNWAEEAFAPIKAANRDIVYENTWGHLAPKKNTNYKGAIWFATSSFGDGVTLINFEFKNLDSSPWFYDAIIEHINELKTEENTVYRVDTIFKNYKFKSSIIQLLSCGGGN